MLAGVEIKQLKRLTDETDSFSEVMRNDWKDFLGDEPAMLVHFTTNLYDPSNPAEERRVWNDPTLIPKNINGKEEDTRIGKSWDWNYPPNK
jgi:dTDP-4-dehydrorhamnose 3,5-epimerase-like enzyme